MDDKRFDLLTKSLSSGISRRSLLRSLAAAVGVAAVGVEAASAAPGGVNGTKKCYGAGSLCTNAKQCCSGFCINRVCAPEVDLCATKNCDDGNPCTTDSCVAGNCTHTPVDAGTPLPNQTAGDCRVNICDGAGNQTWKADDSDVPADDGNDCTKNICNNGTPDYPPVDKGVSCGPGGFRQCDGMGNCVLPGECNPGSQESCYSGPPGTAGVGTCKAGTRTCDPMGMWGSCLDEVLPQAEICGNGVDEDCDGVVDGGCGSECQFDSNCGTTTSCVKHVCISGFCQVSYAFDGAPLPSEFQTPGDCQLLVCDGNGGIRSQNDDTDVFDDGNDCTADVCTNGAPAHPERPLGAICDSIPGGHCDGMGHCVPPLNCNPGSSEQCYSGPAGTLGVGICQAGTRTCDPMGSWGPCIGEVLPSQEICGSGFDEDCDGLVDEDCQIPQCQVATDCGADTPCVQYLCNTGNCDKSLTSYGVPLPPEFQTEGDCQLLICDGAGNQESTADDSDLPGGGDCYAHLCFSGVPYNIPLDILTPCASQPNGLCDGQGNCVAF